MRDPYQVLGVAKTASEAEIKKAFRTLAKKHHPDTHAGDAGAQKRFQEISAAYDIVGDKDKRAKFDAGEIGPDRNARGFDPRDGRRRLRSARFPPGALSAWRRQRQPRLSFHLGQCRRRPRRRAGFSAEDLFADFSAARGRRAGSAQAQKGEDFSAAVTVSFEEAAAGGTRRVVLANGEQIDVKIPVGVKDGQVIRVKGRGGAGRGGGANGDILLSVTVAPHPLHDPRRQRSEDGPAGHAERGVARRQGDSSHPDRSGFAHGAAGFQHRHGAAAEGQGHPRPWQLPEPAGDLYVRLTVWLPDKPDADLKHFAEGWAGAYDPRAKMR